ncbi:signal peptidase II [Serinibacter salmoneus]|uniref:Lipoprotein signal peptidase n=1 Tax=Serinibacter salmoneus TaxID=556530 RepID=A0A2A9CZG8_9MICO|nr:signal peptidase II [Serinibacter salmoneus]PFG19395.1 signal peptidase II [Serinibacter salmoneus]
MTQAREKSAGTRRMATLAVTAVVVLLLDQITKTIALAELTPGARVPAIGDLLGWTLVFNPGAAFSFGTGVTWVFTILLAAVSIGVLAYGVRVRNRWWAITLGALVGGALGNLVDRLAREPGFGVGHVVDFIDYGPFIGNVADIGIVLAAFALVGLSLLGIDPRGGAATDLATTHEEHA